MLKFCRKTLLFVLIVLAAGGCEKSQPALSAKLKVAATIYPLMDIIRNVAGDKVDVIAVMPPGASPHTFEVTHETIRSVGAIKALFKIGSGLDDWADRVAVAQGQPIEIIEVSGNISLRKFPDGSTDPHYWLAVKNAEIITDNVLESLSMLDPAHKDYYAVNAGAYKQKLFVADAQFKVKLASLPNKNFATFHEAWFYFADAYGLNVVAAFEPFPGKEPSPAFLAEFIDTIKKNHVKAIFSEPQFSPDAIRQIAADLGVKLETLDPEGGADPKTAAYLGMMRHNVDKIFNALSN